MAAAATHRTTTLNRHTAATRARHPGRSMGRHPAPPRDGCRPTIEPNWRSAMKRTPAPAALAIRALGFLAALALAAPGPAQAKTEIHFWHAMTGQLGDAVNDLVKQFNDSQSEYEVK